MSTVSVTWSGTITAVSSISHGGQTRGTITLLRREAVVQPDGALVHVPVISGNAFRARLRRVGEELLRDVLGYEAQLPLAAAAALRGGGALAKTSREPLSGRRLQELRHLVPQVGVFGCVGGGTIVEGALKVGKVQPYLAETAHLIPAGSDDDPDRVTLPSAFAATQLESYARGDDTDTHSLAPLATTTLRLTPDGNPDEAQLDDLEREQEASASTDRHGRQSSLMLYSVETFPAGTRFSTWLRLERATALELAFFTDTLATFSRHGWLGGRSAIGHGQVRVDLASTTHGGTRPEQMPDWRAHVTANRDAALHALAALT